MNPVGLILIDKPEGPTSHDVVARVRQATGIRRVGHTGTLDPIASGLLLLCLGWATRLAEFLVGLPKTYRARIRLGEQTDTEDRTGATIARSEAWREVEVDDVRRALKAQQGVIEQLPPAYSAKKVAGRRAYQLAREGSAVSLRAQRVQVARAELLDFDPPDLDVEIDCSSGTYVRSLARDLGVALGAGAHLVGLRRLEIGPFRVEEAVSLEADPSREELLSRVRPPEEAVAGLASVALDSEAAAAVAEGRAIEWSGAALDGPVALMTGGRLLAIGELRDGQLRPRKVFPRSLESGG